MISLNLIHINCLKPLCKVASVNANTELYNGIQNVLVPINEYLVYLHLQLVLFFLPHGLFPQINFPTDMVYVFALANYLAYQVYLICLRLFKGK